MVGKLSALNRKQQVSVDFQNLVIGVYGILPSFICLCYCNFLLQTIDLCVGNLSFGLLNRSLGLLLVNTDGCSALKCGDGLFRIICLEQCITLGHNCREFVLPYLRIDFTDALRRGFIVAIQAHNLLVHIAGRLQLAIIKQILCLIHQREHLI